MMIGRCSERSGNVASNTTRMPLRRQVSRRNRRLHRPRPPPGRLRACPAGGGLGGTGSGLASRSWPSSSTASSLSTSRDRNMQRLRTALPAWKVWPFDDNAAFAYGRLAAELKRIGRPMQQIDIMIAAIACSLGNCSVVTADSHLI